MAELTDDETVALFVYECVASGEITSEEAWGPEGPPELSSAAQEQLAKNLGQ
jgi:hypothetical protein